MLLPYFERRPKQYEHLAIEKTRVVPFDVMIKAFAAMFLNQPERTTRNFKSLKDRLGDTIFAKDHQLAPYYTAAMAYWRVDFMLRNKHLDSKYRVTRFHLLNAMRILSAGWAMPDVSAKRIDGYCQGIIGDLNGGDADELVNRAVDVIDSVASAGDVNGFDRDYVRTEGFTESVIKNARERAGCAA